MAEGCFNNCHHQSHKFMSSRFRVKWRSALDMVDGIGLPSNICVSLVKTYHLPMFVLPYVFLFHLYVPLEDGHASLWLWKCLGVGAMKLLMC